MSTFTPPTDNIVSPVSLDPREVLDPIAQRLFAHSAARARGRNVYYLKDGTVTENFPAATYTAAGALILSGWDQIADVFWGGHTATVTAAEAAALTAAGYVVV